jgi:hypothetical protein
MGHKEEDPGTQGASNLSESPTFIQMRKELGLHTRPSHSQDGQKCTVK